ncbi:MAG: tetratricopeptide repeat protein [Desulfatibacillum sp.]|nr:tetratricopeptide repeat protein [Desulfatibacillum sp.]
MLLIICSILVASHASILLAADKPATVTRQEMQTAVQELDLRHVALQNQLAALEQDVKVILDKQGKQIESLEVMVQPMDKQLAVQDEKIRAQIEKINDKLDPGAWLNAVQSIISWWLGFLGTAFMVMLGVIGFIYYRNVYKYGQEVKADKDEVRIILKEIQNLKSKAVRDVESIETMLNDVGDARKMEPDRAKAVEEAASDTTLPDKERLKALALAATKDGNWGQALSRWESLATLHPTEVSASMLFNWGLAYGNMKRYKEAAEKFAKVVELKPDYAEAWNNWGVALADQKEYGNAVEKIVKAMELKPDYAEAWNNWGLALVNQEKHEEAADKFAKAVELKPDLAEAWSNWGTALDHLRKHEEATHKFAKAVELKPDLAEAWCNWGLTLDHLKKHKEAAQKCARAVELKPDFAEAWSNWGLALNHLKKHKEAAQKCARAVELKPDFANAWNNWGTALGYQEKHEEAIQKFVKAVELKPDFANAWNNWGLALVNQEKHEEAIHKFARAVELKPGFANAWNNWGAALINLEYYEDAAKKFAKVVELEPDDAEAWSNWGVTLMSLKEFREAENKYTKAQELEAGIANYNLACLNALEGKPAECKAWLEKSRDAGNLPSCEQLMTDTDLDPVRDVEWFKEFMLEVCSEEPPAPQEGA